MKTSEFDGAFGKHFEFPIIENECVLIQSAGFKIGIGLKGKHQRVVREWLLAHPFYIENQDIPSKKECGWDITMDHCSKDEIKITFSRDDTRYTLTINCTDSSLRIKPVEITWE